MQGVGITRAAVERHYTQTLFVAAQVHRQLGEGPESAQYCAATLQRQLVQGAPSGPVWLQCVHVCHMPHPARADTSPIMRAQSPQAGRKAADAICAALGRPCWAHA